FRPAQAAVQQAARLCADRRNAPADAGGIRGFTVGPRRLAARPWRRLGPASQCHASGGARTRRQWTLGRRADPRRRARKHHALLADQHRGLLGAGLYRENKTNLYLPAGVPIPAAVTAFPGESFVAPKSWAEKAYPKLIYFHQAEAGGHFAAWEQPEIFTREV